MKPLNLSDHSHNFSGCENDDCNAESPETIKLETNMIDGDENIGGDDDENERPMKNSSMLKEFKTQSSQKKMDISIVNVEKNFVSASKSGAIGSHLNELETDEIK